MIDKDMGCVGALGFKPVKKDSPHESYPSPVESELLKWGPGIYFFKVPLVVPFVSEVGEAPSRWRE